MKLWILKIFGSVTQPSQFEETSVNSVKTILNNNDIVNAYRDLADGGIGFPSGILLTIMLHSHERLDEPNRRFRENGELKVLHQSNVAQLVKDISFEIKHKHNFELMIVSLIHNYPLEEGLLYLAEIYRDHLAYSKKTIGGVEMPYTIAPFNLTKAMHYFKEYRRLRDEIPSFAKMGGKDFKEYALWLFKNFKYDCEVLILAVADKMDAVKKLDPSDMQKEMFELEAYAFLGRYLNYHLKTDSKTLDKWGDRLKAAHFQHYQAARHSQLKNYIQEHYGASYEKLSALNDKWLKEVRVFSDLFAESKGLDPKKIRIIGAPKEIHSIDRKLAKDSDIYDLARLMVIIPDEDYDLDTNKNIFKFVEGLKTMFSQELEEIPSRTKNRLELPPLPSYLETEIEGLLRNYSDLFELGTAPTGQKGYTKSQKFYRFKESVTLERVNKLYDNALLSLFRHSNQKRDMSVHLTFKTQLDNAVPTHLEMIVMSELMAKDYLYGKSAHIFYKDQINDQNDLVYIEADSAWKKKSQAIVSVKPGSTYKDLFEQTYPKLKNKPKHMRFFEIQKLKYENGVFEVERTLFQKWDRPVEDGAMVRFKRNTDKLSSFFFKLLGP
jgi:hypothetical protein